MNVSYAVFQRTRKEIEAAKHEGSVAAQNEQITRQRVERIEVLLSRGFWGRWKWLLFGR